MKKIKICKLKSCPHVMYLPICYVIKYLYVIITENELLSGNHVKLKLRIIKLYYNFGC